MGLFDNIGQDKTTGVKTFVQQAKAFGSLNLNYIFTEGTKAAISIVANAAKFFSDVFGKSECNDQDRVLYERMKDQLPGMIIVLVALGWEDSTNLQAYRDNPERADYGGRPHGAFPCNEGIHAARALFTTLFGVRILNSHALDALDVSVDAYYGRGETTDIPREAVVRAVKLKQTFFPNSTYNRKLWDLNIFQQFPLVKPIPDPVQVGKLYTGNIFGVEVKNGLVQGDPIPTLPTSADEPIIVRDPYHSIIYPNRPATQTGITPSAAGGSLLDKILSFAKTNPMKAALLAGALAIAADEIANEDQ